MARSLPWYGYAGLAGLAGGGAGVAFDIFPVKVLLYCIAWWSYILTVDALVWRRRGDSLLRSRPREFLFLAFWSVALWNLFEILNLRLQNWFYVNVPTEPLYGAVFSAFSYSTVLPGIFETYDLLCAWQVGERLRVRPWRIGPPALHGCLGLGAGMLAASMLWPRYAYPLVWGFAVFLGDPLCYRSFRVRSRSLLGHIERGDPRPFVRVLLAGLICGGLWEFWNFWAHTKWMYTVPFFEDTKWFEMPPLGFLGFPPFAVECYVLLNILNLARGGRGWESAAHTGPGAPRRWGLLAIVGACVFNAAVYLAIDRFTVQSYSPRLADMDSLSPAAAEQLGKVGILRPHTLLRRTRTPADVSTLSQESGIPAEVLLRLREAARLVDLDGLGVGHANALRRLGITRVEELAARDPAPLHPRWQAEAKHKPPTLAQVKAWVRAARARIIHEGDANDPG